MTPFCCHHREVSSWQICGLAFRYVLGNYGGNFHRPTYIDSFPLQPTVDKPRRNRLVGASIWAASEVIRRKSYTTGVNIRSFGVTIIEMAEAQPSMFSVPPVRARELIGTRVTPHFANPREHSKVLRQFLDPMQVRNAFERETAKSLLIHKFLRRARSHSFLVELVPFNASVGAEGACD